MDFEVTATRKRPRTFDELAGQEFVSATLKSSIESGRIAHAYLFCGPRGCGKTSAARILARSLNCEKGPTAAPCGECSACREIKAGCCLDVIEIDGASNNGVSDVRNIKDEVMFPPNSCKYKIYIIDEVHMLSTSAFNALLKTIEEPPPHVIFIFATTEQHKVPATIKSRCQQFSFKLIHIEKIAALLKDICAEMQITAQDEALLWIARESGGSLRDAYTLFDQVASFSQGNITTQIIREKLALVGHDNLTKLADCCAAGDFQSALQTVNDSLENGVSIEQFITDLAGYYRSLLLIKSVVTRESVLGYSVESFSAAARDILDFPRLQEAMRLLLELYRSVQYSISPRFELETVVSRLCSLPAWVSNEELRSSIDNIRGIIGGSAVNFAINPQKNTQTPVFSSENGKTNDINTEMSLTEGFKQRVAQIQTEIKEAPKLEPEQLPPDVALVKSVFKGEIVSS